MNVRDLKELLSQFDDDQEVCLAYPSGDYWGTTLATEIRSVTLGNIMWYENRSTHKVANPDRNYEDSELKEVVLLEQ